MNKLQTIALCYLMVLLGLIYGYAVAKFQVFPHTQLEHLVKEVQAFYAGDPTEGDLSVAQKLKNDMGIWFERWFYEYPATAVANARPLEYDPLSRRKDPALVYVDPGQRSGYRVIVGAFDLEDAFWGALLLNPDGQAIHHWALTTRHLPTNKAKGQLKNLYGVHVFRDGSVIFNMQEDGGGIVKVDACGEVVWSIPGSYHHAISPDGEGYFWSFTGSQRSFDQNMIRVNVQTGEVNQIIEMSKVRAANPDLHIWDLNDAIYRNDKKLKLSGNMAHGNDIDPLPAALVDKFPGFQAGDLAISYATTNLVFVLDPKTLKVKWWRIGITDHQHDPDWEPDGRIAIFSNNYRSEDYSNIVAVDPVTSKYEVIVRGRDLQFKSLINGRHQLTAFGTRIITSSKQGWVFEVDGQGKIVFSFVNNVDTERGRAMHLSEAWRFPEDYFDRPFWEECR